jgi:N-hydroxyarylamine O-acetyltransferase
MSDFVPDLDAYFARIGYTGPREPTLATLHAITGLHAAAIPFENLDILLGRGISLDPAAVERKLVHDRRGGYCFEQNSHLLRVLGALGFSAAPISARVRWQRPRDFTPPRTHVFVRVELDGASWLTDVGIGSLSLTSAIPLDESGNELPTPHEPRRILREGARLHHQVRLGREWHDVCEFTLEEMPPIDRDLANWWTSTNPNSKFRQSLVAARAGPNATRYVINNREFAIRDAEGRANTRDIASPSDLLALLATHFSLHFPADTRFILPNPLWPE